LETVTQLRHGFLIMSMPPPVAQVLRKAQSHMEAGELTEAEALYKQVLSKFPKNKKAIQSYQKLRADVAQKVASEAEPSQEEVQELISLYARGQFEEVLSKVKPLISLFPKAIALFNLQGASNAGLARYEEAIGSYRKAIKIKPGNAALYNNLSVSLQKKGDFDAAIENCRLAIKIEPDYAEAYNNMGNAQKEKGDLDVAIDSYKKALKIQPDYAEAHNNMGNALTWIRDLDAAIYKYKHALKIRPDYAEAHYNIGNALKEKGDRNAAIDSYKKALKIRPDYAEAYYNMGNALKEKGDRNAAIDSYKKALKIRPDYAEAYLNIGDALENNGDLDAAIDSYKKAIKINTNYAEAYNNMGISLQKKGQFNAAIDNYKQALKFKNDYAEAYCNIGSAHKAKGELDKAIDSYRQAITLEPDLAEANHFLACLSGKTTGVAPRAYVEKLFDDYASTFEYTLVDTLEYHTPKALTEMIVQNNSDGLLGSILDLGCGTGLGGLELKQFCQNLEGIDLSKMMIEKAKVKGVYDKLIHGEIVEHLSNANLDFDYFYSSDVFVYVGDLFEIFRLIKSRNARRGKLVFSTEHTEREGFFLEISGRYSHSKSYIKSLCDIHNYSLTSFTYTKLRKEKGNFLTGGLYLLDF